MVSTNVETGFYDADSMNVEYDVREVVWLVVCGDCVFRFLQLGEAPHDSKAYVFLSSVGLCACTGRTTDVFGICTV